MKIATACMIVIAANLLVITAGCGVEKSKVKANCYECHDRQPVPNTSALDEAGTIVDAVIKGELDTVLNFLDKGADVNAEDGCTGTPLMWAAFKGNAEMVEVLIAHGADVNIETHHHGTALSSAVGAGHQDIVLLLIKHGANKYKSNGESLLMSAAYGNNTSMLNFLIDSELSEVNEIDKSGNTALMCAAEYINDNIETVRMLIDKGANVNAEDVRGETALMAAATRGRTKVAKLLLDCGANINTKSKKGKTALMFAAEAFSTHVHDISRKGFPSIKTEKDYIETLRLLLEYGADINAADNEGKTALQHANEDGNDDISRFLRSKGAKEL